MIIYNNGKLFIYKAFFTKILIILKILPQIKIYLSPIIQYLKQECITLKLSLLNITNGFRFLLVANWLKYLANFIIVIQIVLFSNISYAEVVTKKTPYSGSVLFKPNDNKSYPGILLLHGSEGGSIPYVHLTAWALANDGFSVLAFCWYNCAKNPITEAIDTLENIELEKTFAAFNWLKSSPYVANKKTGIYGFSRGAEQALLLAQFADSENIDISAVAVHAPSDKIVEGFSWTWSDSRCWVCKINDTNKCSNRSNYAIFKWNIACGKMPPDYSVIAKTKAWLYKKDNLAIGNDIKIELYKKPLFISHGMKDELWSYKRSKTIVNRKKQHNQEVQAHFFPNSGHVFRYKDAQKRRQLVSLFFKDSLR